MLLAMWIVMFQLLAAAESFIGEMRLTNHSSPYIA